MTPESGNRQAATIGTHEPTVAFRGTRNYVHTADYYEELLVGAAALGLTVEAGPIQLNIRRLTRRQPVFHYLEDGAAAPHDTDSVMDFRFTAGGRAWAGYVSESDREIADRKAYEEARIWDHAVLADKNIRLRRDTGMTPIEVITALGVLQHKTLYPPQDGHRWLCVRVRFAHPPTPAEVDHVDIDIRQFIAGKISKSSIALRDGLLGEMSFILGAP